MHVKQPVRLVMWWFACALVCPGAVRGGQGAPRATRDTAGQPRSKQASRWDWRPEVLAVSPNGEWLAARVDKLSKWGAVWLLNLTNGSGRVVTSGPSIAVTGRSLGCLAFSPDSKLLAVCGSAGEIGFWWHSLSDYAVQLWDISTGEEGRRLT